MAAELTGGILAGSLSVLTDAFHILADIAGFIIIIIGLYTTMRPASFKMTYGFHRAEVIGALLSILLIWGLSIWLIVESINRFITPQEVNGTIMLITASGGLGANFIMAFVLFYLDPDKIKKEHSSETQVSEANRRVADLEKEDIDTNRAKLSEIGKAKDLNIQAAFIHILGDFVQSLGVVIAGAIIYTHPDYVIADPICTLFFCVCILSFTFPIVKKCTLMMMEGSPHELDLEDITRSLKEIEDVIAVHDLHVWSLSAGKVAMSCHLVSDSPSIVLDQATKLLKDKYRIGHITIQIEVSDENYKFLCENELH